MSKGEWKPSERINQVADDLKTYARLLHYIQAIATDEDGVVHPVTVETSFSYEGNLGHKEKADEEQFRESWDRVTVVVKYKYVSLCKQFTTKYYDSYDCIEYDSRFEKIPPARITTALRAAYLKTTCPACKNILAKAITKEALG